MERRGIKILANSLFKKGGWSSENQAISYLDISFVDPGRKQGSGRCFPMGEKPEGPKDV
jgi:hypothetical protein